MDCDDGQIGTKMEGDVARTTDHAGRGMAGFPAEVAAIYGVHVLGSIYPLALAAHGVAGVVAAPLTGLGVDITGGY